MDRPLSASTERQAGNKQKDLWSILQVFTQKSFFQNSGDLMEFHWKSTWNLILYMGINWMQKMNQDYYYR